MAPKRLFRMRLPDRITRSVESRYYTERPKSFWIYALVGRRDGTVWYVGMTKNPHRRELQHGKSWQPKTLLGQWLLGPGKNVDLEFRILEEVALNSGLDPADRESHWIFKFRKEGNPIINTYPKYEIKEVYHERRYRIVNTRALTNRHPVTFYLSEADYKWVQLQASGNLSHWCREKILESVPKRSESGENGESGDHREVVSEQGGEVRPAMGREPDASGHSEVSRKAVRRSGLPGAVCVHGTKVGEYCGFCFGPAKRVRT
jgi:hypothetical protein